MALSEGRRTILRLVVALTVLAGVYVGLAAWLGRHVPVNTTVDGIGIGGKSGPQAKAWLERQLAGRDLTPVRLLTPDSRTITIDPAAAGLKVDLDATVDGLTGFSLSPGDIWHRLTGGGSEPLEISADTGRLAAALDAVSGQVDRPVREGAITFAGGKVTAVKSSPGQVLDVAGTSEAVVAAWPRQPDIKAVVSVVEPKLSAAEIDRATREFAVPAMSAPLLVKAGSAQVSLSPAQLAPALTLAPDASGVLTPSVDGAKVLAAIRAAGPTVERSPVDATVRIVDGKPKVIPAVAGQRLDPRAVQTAVLPALTSVSRTAVVTPAVTQPKVTTAVAQSWKITEIVSSFTSVFPTAPSNASRTHNIKIAVKELDGTLVKPGATFSLNGELGERTAAKGYQQAPVINGGRLTRDYGGGISQVSTTVFNTAFFAGVRIDQHTPHSFYISRYPEGREATISWPSLDNRWTNDSGYGILVQTWVEGNAIRMRFWGTKVWDIDAVKGPRRNVTEPRDIVDDSPSCVTQSPSVGFDVTVSRLFKRNGATVRTQTFSTHYIPEDKVTCTHPAAG